AILNDYFDGRLVLHAHAGVRSSDPTLQQRNYCVVFHCWPLRRIEVADRFTVCERYVVLGAEECAQDDCERSVFVIVRQLREREQPIIGGVPSYVSVSSLDEVTDCRIDARQSRSDVVTEGLFLGVDRELDSRPLSFGQFVGRSQTLTYEPPSNVVEGRPV